MNRVLRFIGCLFFMFANIACDNASSLNRECKVISLSVHYNSHEYPAVIDQKDQTILVNLPWEAPLEGLPLKITLSEGASYQLEDKDFFLLPQQLTIIAQNGTKNKYTLTIRNRIQVDFTDTNIEIIGCKYIERKKNELRMSRFGPLSLANDRLNYMKNGQTQSGVIIRFTTSSNKIKIRFKEIDGPHWGLDYGVWLNSSFQGSQSQHVFELTNPNPSLTATWEITPSLMNAVSLSSIELSTDGQIIKPITVKQNPIYVAIGNSITQGVGQGNAAYKSYPFLLGKKLGFETINFGVGGSKISPIIAYELENLSIDLVTILWGFNDWYYELISCSDYIAKIQETIKIIRLYQPHVPILCIGFTPTTNATPIGQRPISEYREALFAFVNEQQKKGDTKIDYFDASQLNIELMDGVHPSENGASTLAEALQKTLLQGLLSNIE